VASALIGSSRAHAGWNFRRQPALTSLPC
jgi:hypothetical protein